MARGAARGASSTAATSSTRPVPQKSSGLALEYDGDAESAPAATPRSGSGPNEPDRSGPNQTSSSRRSSSTSRPVFSSGGAVNDGATVALVLITWVWFVLPWIVGGKPRVKAVLMAKFLNKAPNGERLP